MQTITGLPALQQLTWGHPSVKIAILDGPVDLEHSCFNSYGGNLVPVPENSILPSGSAGLAKKHGTAVCSLIFGKPGTAVTGVAPGCSGIIIPIYTENEDGVYTSASQAGLARAIQTAIEKGAHIINISGGEFSKYGDAEFLLQQAIEEAYKAGVLIVAAAGNEGCRCLHVPAAHNQVLAVGSMDEEGNPTPETNFGDKYKVNGIIAPGKNLVAALPDGKTFLTSGATSYATPVVSGIVALLMSLQIQRGSKPDAYAVRSILEKTAIPCSGKDGVDCNRFLRGKLNLPAAMEAVINSSSTAAGNDNSIHKKLMTMSHNTDPQTEEIKQEAIPVQLEEVLPSAVLMEPLSETPGTEAGIVHTMVYDNSPAITPSADVPLTGDTATTTESPLVLSRDGPAIHPPITPVPGNTYSTQLIKNSKNQTMEQNTANQHTEAPVSKEPILDINGLNPSGEIDLSDCGCGGNKTAAPKAEPPAKVYALGNINYDFGSEAHRDSFIQSMGGTNPHDPAAILKYLKDNPFAAEELVWTLNIDSTPVYALYPNGSHAHTGYEIIQKLLAQQQNGSIQRISVPGISAGETTLLNGQKVANLFPRFRGVFSWTTEALVSAATGGTKGTSKLLGENIANFLNRVYYQLRNLGITPQDRALNYAATNAFQVSGVLGLALRDTLELNDIAVLKSPICRPGSDCYDVVLSFFNPKERLTQARKEYRFTVDVSDVVPVTLGDVRSWSVY